MSKRVEDLALSIYTVIDAEDGTVREAISALSGCLGAIAGTASALQGPDAVADMRARIMDGLEASFDRAVALTTADSTKETKP